MNIEQIQTVFEHCGLSSLGDKLAFKLWLKGFGEKADESTLEEFLLTYDIKDESVWLVDEFLYHFDIYKTVIKSFEGQTFLYM